MKQAAYDRLLTEVYNCPGDAAAWTQLAGNLSRMFKAQHVHLVVFRPDGSVRAEGADDPDAGREYSRDYASRDLAVPRVMASAPGKALWSHSLLTPAELACCPVQNELLPRVGVGSRTWVHTPLDGDLTFSSGILHPRARGLDAHGVRRLEQLHGHLHQAMHLHLALETAQDARRSLEAGLEVLGTGVVLLDRSGRVLFANRAARRMFDAGRLRMSVGHLQAPAPADDAALRRLVAAALGDAGLPSGGALSLPGLRLRAIPVGEPRAGLGTGAAAVMLVHDGIAPRLDPNSLSALGLTPAEAALAVALASGETLETYAAHTCRALGTVRAQLRAVFGKTGTHRQSELVLYLLQMSGTG